MRLKSITYSEHEGAAQAWHIDTLTLGPRNLLVGRNSVGKSRALSIIAALARNLIGMHPPGLSGHYVCIFDEKGSEYRYEMEYSEQRVISERLVIDGSEYLTRGEGGIGKIMAEKIGDGQMIDFQVPPNAFAAVARRDSIQHSFVEPLFSWANSLRFYQFAGGMGQGMLTIVHPAAPAIDDRDQNAVVGIFREGKRLFGDAFVDAVKADMTEIDYSIDTVDVGPLISMRFPANGPEPISVVVRESGLACITDQFAMSTGMFRVLAILIHVNFASFKGSASSVLIDDIGEGLDFDRSCRLIQLLREKAIKFDFQLVMSSNDKFVMNNVPLDEWTVLHRTGSDVHVRNHENSREAFDEFKFTGLSNFSFFEMNALEMTTSSDIEAKNA